MSTHKEPHDPLVKSIVRGRRSILLGSLATVIAPPSGPPVVLQVRSDTSTPGQLPAFRVQANAAMAAGSPITLGHLFAKGDVPAGRFQKLLVTASGRSAQVQVDQSNAWPDGSLRFAALSFKAPSSLSKGQPVSYQLGTAPSALSGSAITIAQLAAASDFKLHFKLATPFLAAVKDNGGQGSGAHSTLAAIPAQVQAGQPFSVGFYAISYVGGNRVATIGLRNGSDTAVGSYIKVFDGTRGSVRLAAPPKPGSYTVVSLDENGKVTARSPALTVVARSPALTGPPGDTFTISANDILANFPAWNATKGWGRNPLGGWELIRSGPLCTEWRVWRFLKRDSDGASHRWVKAVLYVRAWSDGQGNIIGYHVLPGMFQSNCYGAHPSGTVGDPSVPLAHYGVAELYNGSTRVVAYGGPNDKNGVGQVATFPMEGWWGALPDGSVPWVGAAAAPSYMVAHDFTYMARRTRCIPPYQLDLNVPNYTGNDRFSVAPNFSMLTRDINQTGDGPDDERIGYIHYSGICLLMNPFDRAREIRELAFGWSWATWEIWQIDERTGQPVNTTRSNIGPLISNTEYCTNQSHHLGSPGWLGYGPEPNNRHAWDYNIVMDPSHLPSLWIVPLLRTGHAAFQEIAVASACSINYSIDVGGRNLTIGGVNYDNVFSYYYPQADNCRSVGWAARSIGTAERMMPDTHPMRAYIKKTMDDNAAFSAIGPGEPTGTGYEKFGYVYGSYDPAPGHPENPFNYGLHLFSVHIVAIGLGMEEWVGDRVGWRGIVEKLAPGFTDAIDDAQGKRGWMGNLYGIMPKGANGVIYPDIATMVLDIAHKAYGYTGGYPMPTTGFVGLDGGQAEQTYLPLPLGQARAALCIAARWDTPLAKAASVLAALEARAQTMPVPGLRFSGTNGVEPTWAFAAPESQPKHRASAGTGLTRSREHRE